MQASKTPMRTPEESGGYHVLHHRTLAGMSILLSTTLTAAGSGDWHQWRGPHRDGLSRETGLLKTWPSGGPRLVWKATGLGLGYSTVSLSAKRIFTMGDRDGASSAHALKLDDGTLLWTTKIGKAGAPGWGGFAGPRCTPTVDGDLVFVTCQYGEIACLDAATGKKIWQKSLVDDFGGNRPEWGFAESPLVDGEKLICTPGGSRGTIVALNKRTGEKIWQSKDYTDEAAYASVIRARICGTDQYVQLTPKSVGGVALDGRLLWRAPRRGRTAVVPTPICLNDSVYVASGYGVGCNLFAITTSNGTFTATQTYASRNMSNHHGGVLLVGEHLYGYADSKGWTCQEFKTGDVVWKDKSLGKGSLTYADGHLYLRAESGKGTVALIEATAEGYKEKSRFDQPDRSKMKSWPHPVVAGGKLYLRDQDILLCYDVKAR